MLEALKRDAAHYDHKKRKAYLNLGFWLTVVYRAAQASHEVRFAPLRRVLVGAARAAGTPLRFVSGVVLPSGAQVGPGLCLHHPWSIVVSPNAVIGEDCSLHQDVVIGEDAHRSGAPRLGNRVRVFAGAKIIGPVTVGDDVEIGANAVVTRDIPSGATVASPGGRPIPKEMLAKMSRGIGP